MVVLFFGLSVGFGVDSSNRETLGRLILFLVLCTLYDCNISNKTFSIIDSFPMVTV